ncbi:DUF6279 family lipoprotein [Bowmanella pacifica]|uniref:Lipoprotein n=1 Tax=Bowmanella pacifica TaxID=502051 RepID=A0A917Z1H4_9ALTE|nr:DUF6279 family lipoprotein [Bowmanella pacifica]GGO70347.1 hypothetical protein GCM10010982_23630 [Bowmanella pacifica]
MARILAAILLVLGLSGCSTTFVYNNLDWLVHWYLDDYVDLNRAQKKQFDSKMADWLVWHRNQQLPRYRDDLQALRQQLEAGQMSEPQWQEVFARGRGHWMSLLNYLAADLTDLALLLTDEQIEALFTELDKQQVDREQQRNEFSPEERLARDLENRVEDLQEWTGRLSSAQKAEVAKWNEGFQPTFEARMLYRRSWQAQAKQMLLSRDDSQSWRKGFMDLLVRPQQFQSAQLQQADEHNRRHYAQMLVSVAEQLSDKQKRHVLRELQARIDDLDDLMAR